MEAGRKKMTRVGVMVVSVFLWLSPALARADANRGGSFSAKATNLCESDERTLDKASLASPDGSFTVKRIQGPSGSQWAIDTGHGLIQVNTEDWPCPEFLWAPDSKSIAVTYSDGGNIGNFHVSIYHVKLENKEPNVASFKTGPWLFMFPIDITGLATEDFLSTYPKCYSPEEPNAGAVSWGDDSTKLLIAEEVLPHSNCDDMGTFALYELSVPDGKILKKYSQLEGKRVFGEALGSELKNAEDDCFLKMDACEIPDLHKLVQKTPIQQPRNFKKGELLYLAGPRSIIEENSDGYSPEKAYGGDMEIAGGVALGWFDEVQVLEDADGKVKFARPIARHPTNIAWAPESAFRRSSDFKKLNSWPTPGAYQFCNRRQECFSLRITKDASFSISQASHDDTVCEIVETDGFDKCRTRGAIYIAPGFIELRGTGPDDVKDFFVYYGKGQLCRIGYSVDFFGCDPNTVTYTPETPDHH